MKKQERSRPSRRLSPLETLETRALMTMAATAPLPAVNASAGTTVAPVNLDNYFKDPQATPNIAVFNTTLGTIPVVLTPQTTPITVNNFLSYVNKGDYNNTIVHRSVPGFIWQAGGFQLSASSNIAAIPADAPIKNEFGASNVRGTIAMAKLGSDPNSATSEFFFNESDSNASNLDNQNGGFTVFGHVLGNDGLGVMDAIANVAVPSPGPLSSPLDQIPLQNYTAGASVQPSNLVLINNVTTASEVYTSASDSPSVATVAVQGSNLTINPISAGTAHIVVVGYGSDGTPATETFSVTVTGTAQPGTTATTPTSTPTATTTTATTPSTAILPPLTGVGAPASSFHVTSRGPIPTSVVAGRSTRIQQVVSLKNDTAPINQNERVTLSLVGSPNGATAQYDIAGTTKLVKAKAGKVASLTVATKSLSGSVPAGTYQLIVQVTDATNATTTIATGKTLVVRSLAGRSTGQ